MTHDVLKSEMQEECVKYVQARKKNICDKYNYTHTKYFIEARVSCVVLTNGIIEITIRLLLF